jgi:hypothetical protein
MPEDVCAGPHLCNTPGNMPGIYAGQRAGKRHRQRMQAMHTERIDMLKGLVLHRDGLGYGEANWP